MLIIAFFYIYKYIIMYIFLMNYFALTGNIVKFNFKETMPTPRFEYIFGVYIYIYIFHNQSFYS